MAVAGAVPASQFDPITLSTLQSGARVGNYQLLNGHIMDLRTTEGQTLLQQHQALVQQSSTATPLQPAPTDAGMTGNAMAGATTDPTSPAADGDPTNPGSSTPDAPAVDPMTQFLQQQAKDQVAAAKASKEASQRDAAALIRQTLATYNLPASLGDWAWQEIVSGKSQNEVMLDLYQRPEFKAEFGAVMDGRQKAGLSAMSPGEIVSWRNTALQMMHAAGLPAGLHDSKAELDQNMIDNVSAQEFHDRVAGAADAMFKWDPNDIRALQDHGLTTGDLIGMWLNPEKAQPLIEKTVAAARIGGAAYRTGYGQVGNDQADLYATQGVTQQQAQAGFSQLAHDQQLYNPLAGAGGSEDQITQADQMAAAFGGSNAQQRRIEQRRQQRQATFQDGGGYASSQTGMSGMGSSAQ